MQAFKFTRKPVSRSKILQAVDTLVREIVVSGNILSIYLFGSASEGKQSDQSDIDLLIVVPDVSTIKSSQKKLRHIQKLTDFPVDLVWVDREQFERKKDIGGVCMIAFHDGQRVYPKHEGNESD